MRGIPIQYRKLDSVVISGMIWLSREADLF